MGRAGKRVRTRGRHHVARVHSTKISACLIEVMEPYREECKSREAYCKLVALTSTAWNISLVSSAEREGIWEQILQTFSTEDRSYIGGILQRLVTRKEQLFPNDHRFVASADVLDEGTHYRVVAATISTGEENG